MNLVFPVALTGLCLAAFSTAHAQIAAEDKSQPLIVVTGTGQASRPAETAILSFVVRGEGPDASEAVKALAASRAQIESSLRGLPKIDVQNLRADNVSTQEVRPRNCTANYGTPQLNLGECAVTGVIASLTMQARIAPISKIGDAVSIVTQVGAKNVGFRQGELNDRQTLVDEAAKAALANAKRQAAALAAAGGGRLGSVMRIQNVQSSGAIYREYSDEALTSNAPPPPPLPIPPSPLKTPLDLALAPVTEKASVTVAFTFER